MCPKTIVSRYLSLDGTAMSTFGDITAGTLNLTFQTSEHQAWGKTMPTAVPTNLTGTLMVRIVLQGPLLTDQWLTLMAMAGKCVPFVLQPQADGAAVPGTAEANYHTIEGEVTILGWGDTPGEGVTTWTVEQTFPLNNDVYDNDGTTLTKIWPA